LAIGDIPGDLAALPRQVRGSLIVVFPAAPRVTAVRIARAVARPNRAPCAGQVT
jgi:hypothetical protein